MVTYAQAQERAEEWINGDVPAYQHREVRVREFELGFVVWGEDRAEGPRSDAGGQRLVIARDSGEATLWPALPVGEVIRRYEEEYGRAQEPQDAVSAPAAARLDLNQTSFLLTPPEWLQEAADKLGVGERRPDPVAGEGPASPGGGGPAETQAGVPAEASAGASAVADVPEGATPWAGTDTNAETGDEDRSVPLPATVFAPPLGDSDDAAPRPQAVAPDAPTALMSGGSQLPPTAVVPALDVPGAGQGGTPPQPPAAPGTPPQGVPPYPPAGTPSYGYPQGAPGYGYPQAPGGAPQPPAGPGAPGRRLAPNAGDIADAATSKAAPPPKKARGGVGAPPPPPGAPGAPGTRPGTATPPPAGGYVPTQLVSALGPEGPEGQGGPEGPQAPGHVHHAATVLADPSQLGGPAPQGPAAPGTPNTSGAFASPAGQGTPTAPGAPQPPGAPGAPGMPGASGTPHPAPGAPQPPGAPGAPGAHGMPGGPGTPPPAPGAPLPPGAPGAAGGPGMPNASGAFAAPGAPQPPGAPGMPGASGTPGTPPPAPGAPLPPGAPGAPGAPGMPNPPGAPAAPGMPPAPGVTQPQGGTPGAAGAPGAPAAPGGPGMPPVPGAPQPPGAPGASQASGGPVPPHVPGVPAGPGAPQPPGGVHHAETVLAAPPVGGPGAPLPPPAPGTLGAPGVPPAGAYGYPQQGQPTVGPGYQAVLRYRAQDGSEQQVIRRSAPGTPHPEWQIFHELRAMNVPPDQVLELHTELESCALPGAYCARMIREQWPQARIASIAPYGTDHASRQQGMQQLLAHQGELHQVADGPARPAPVRAPLPPVQAAPPVPPEGIAQELAAAFGPGVFRFEQQAVSRQGVPPIVAHTLVLAGLPVDMGPFFWAQAQPGRPVPTLAELAAERGVQPAADAGSYLVMGSDFGKAICVQYGTANIVAVPVEAGPGGAPVPPQFVNTGLPEFARCLALLGRMWRLRYGLNQEQAGRWTVDFQAQLAALDPAALGSPESWWSVLLEQMWDGLL
ncbi:SUKH-4 family immunity protein [Streptomyces sp. NPDC046881]|uniref:SUKH-4 family immunity protein n=1 Tax=Streptomyces sp. NPDC046881 TaxID=3155374 RepID=UPI0034047058